MNNLNTDLKYKSSERPRQKLKQLGSNPNLQGYNRPLLKRLQTYQSMSTYDPVIRQGLDIITDALVGALSEIEHRDPEIQEFVRYNAAKLNSDYLIDLGLVLKRMIKTCLWSGSSTTETIFDLDGDNLFIKDFVTYHPATILIRTNQQGRLVDNEPSFDGPNYMSGIYQMNYQNYRFGSSEVKLPLWKVCHLVNEFEFGNYYGKSVLESCYRWHVLREAFVDMQVELLDRFANPLTAIIMPKVNSGQEEYNPLTGEKEMLTSQQVLERQLGSANPNNGNYFFLPFIDQSMKPDIKILTAGASVGNVYMEAIKYCELQLTRSILLPYGFIDNYSSNSDTVSERQVEIFNRVITTLHRTFIQPFISQTFHRLIKFNFKRESAQYPPTMAIRKAMRPEQRVAMMQMIKGLTDVGYYNPTDPADWSMIREMVDALDREQTPADIEFIKQLIIYPKQPKPEKPVKTKKSNGVVGEDTGTSAGGGGGERATEGKIKGTGNPGRPTGTPAPQNKTRPLKKDSK